MVETIPHIDARIEIVMNFGEKFKIHICLFLITFSEKKNNSIWVKLNFPWWKQPPYRYTDRNRDGFW